MGNFGAPVHLEATSSNASGAGGTPFLLYPSGSKTAFTLASTQYLTITDIIFISTAEAAYVLAFDAAIATSAGGALGTIIAKGKATKEGGLAHHFETPMTGPKGVMPYLCADVGQVDCILVGYIQNT